MDQLSIECIPDQIPKSITLDVSELKVGHGLTVEQIQVDEGIKILNDKDEVIVSLSPLRVSEETEEESEDAENAEPVVIGSENKEE
jgi:large subunit ribosomal protein L25